MLKTIVLLKIYVEIMMHFIFQLSILNRKFKRLLASLLNKSINFFKENLTVPKNLDGREYNKICYDYDYEPY